MSAEQPAVRERHSSGEPERRSSSDFVLVQPPGLHRGNSWSGQDGVKDAFLLHSNNERCTHFVLHQEGHLLSSAELAPEDGVQPLSVQPVCDKPLPDAQASPTGVMQATTLFTTVQ